MAVTLVKETTTTSGSSSTTLTCTLASAPTAGNLLVLAMAGDKNTGALTLAGFTQLYSLLSTSVSLYYWYKVSAGTETSISPSWATTSTAGNTAWYAEYEDTAVTGSTWSVEGQASNITNEATTLSRSTGTTAATTLDGIGIAVAAVDSVTNVTTVSAWGNSYAVRYSSSGTFSRGGVFVATKTEVATTAATSTFSYTGTADQVSTAIAVFAKVASGISAPATEASGVGLANDAVVTITGGSLSVPATEATGTGVSAAPVIDIAPGPTEAVATGVANNATVTTAVITNAPATEAIGTGAAIAPSLTITGSAAPVEATAIGAALDPQINIVIPVVISTVTRQAGKPVARYVIYARNASLLREGVIEDFQTANLKLRHNDVGTWEITVNRGRKEAVWLTTPGWGIEAVMYLVDGTQVPLISGPISTRRHVKNVNENKAVITGHSDDIFLSRALAHPVPNASFPPYNAQIDSGWTGSPATVIRQYVWENIGAGAILPRRIPGLVLGADVPVFGTNVVGHARWHNLLKFIQDLAISGGGLGFRIRQVDAELEFQTFVPVDHSTDVTLSEALGNLQGWEYVSESPEATYVFVGGQGEGTARTIIERPDSDAIIKWGRREVFADRRDTNVAAELQQAAIEYQADRSELVGLSVTPLDTVSCIYGKHYNLGDKVTIQLEGPAVPVTEIVREVDISLTPNGPQILKPVIGTPNSGLITRLFRKYRETQSRISNLERR